MNDSKIVSKYQIDLLKSTDLHLNARFCYFDKVWLKGQILNSSSKYDLWSQVQNLTICDMIIIYSTLNTSGTQKSY